ncbi:MAG TPA: hypothetical protein DD415_07155 [Clostridiales bacterium]|nr:hypothetical protein [Clostridiales bacterium]
MVAFVVAYSLILTALAAAVAALCFLHTLSKKRELEKQAVANRAAYEGKAAFEGVYGEGETAFILLDKESAKPVYVSPNVNRFFGVSAERAMRDVQSLKENADKSCVREFVKAYSGWNGENTFKFEFNYGDGKYAALSAASAKYGGKSYTAFTIYDVTEHKNALGAMKKELDAALVQAAAKSSFLSSMSHEIRTPMNGVMGMMALAKMNIDDKEKVLGYLDRAGDLSVFLLGMINDILDISKIESGKMQLFNTQMDIFGFAEKIKNMFNGTITGKGINFKVETIDFTARYLVGDELRLTQVVTNLVSNANKFTPAGGSIFVTFKQLDNIGGCVQLMIRVRDTGKGIAPENIRKVMRPFEQEEASTAHNYGGTGLGLAICDNIVRLMGGNIVIDSTLGKGTDFSVFLSLPVADVKQDMSEPVSLEEEAAETDFTFEGCRILLAEDNEVNAEIAIDILESEGAVMTHAADGRQAVDIFTEKPEHSFDLILMDIQMPRLNGRDAAREIRGCGKGDAESVPIIALSADAFVEDVKLSEAAGMDGHVSKPIDFDELRKRAGEIIAAKKR